jgi:putative hydrolase of the HAD superfamily
MQVFHPEKFSRLPQAILFDTDNTLYPYEMAHVAAQKAVRHKAVKTLAIEPEDFDRVFGQARDEIKNRLGQTASSHSRLLYFQRMLEMLGLGTQVLLALDFEQTYWRVFLANAVLFDDVPELLDDIRLLGIPTAIVTDLTAQIQFRKIVYFGLDSFFSHVVTSEEAGFDKPHPSPFRIALDKLRAPGEQTWMIGDNPDNDIRGAREQIGAITLQKLHDGNGCGRAESQPDAAFEDFADLRRFIAELSEHA